MSGAILIGLGIGILFTTVLAGFMLGKWSIIPITIGVILIILGVITLVIDDLDCKNYCQCKGKDYYKMRVRLNQCECFDENPDIKLARRQCNAYCFNKIADYNEANGRCYCT